MPFTLTMPKLSPTMEEGTIVKWHKKEGDQIEPGDLLIEVATDKATVEHNALDGGWLRKILIKENGSAIVNQAIAILTETKEENIDGYQPEGAKAAESSPSQESPTSTESQSASEKELPKSSVKPRTMAQPSFAPEVPVGAKLSAETKKEGERILASPLARKLAKDQGLDISSVAGSGPDGRVMSRDLGNAQKLGAVSSGRRELPQIPSGTYEEEALTPMRKVIAQRLQEAKTFIPHFYVSLDIDAEPLINAREQLKVGDIKATVNDFIIKGSALSLREHPTINSGFFAANNTIIRFKTIDVAVAVSLPTGLITPIIRHTDYKSLLEISSEMHHLAKKAKEGKLDPQEYKGGSFTISNMGMLGVSTFQAIINPPQAAILAVSGIRDIPVVKKGQVVPGKVMTLTLSVDHRVVDGVVGAQFLKTLQKYLENPALILHA